MATVASGEQVELVVWNIISARCTQLYLINLIQKPVAVVLYGMHTLTSESQEVVGLGVKKIVFPN